MEGSRICEAQVNLILIPNLTETNFKTISKTGLVCTILPNENCTYSPMTYTSYDIKIKGN